MTAYIKVSTVPSHLRQAFELLNYNEFLYWLNIISPKICNKLTFFCRVVILSLSSPSLWPMLATHGPTRNPSNSPVMPIRFVLQTTRALFFFCTCRKSRPFLSTNMLTFVKTKLSQVTYKTRNAALSACAGMSKCKGVTKEKAKTFRSVLYGLNPSTFSWATSTSTS